MSPTAATRPASDVKPHLSPVGCAVSIESMYDFPAVIIIKPTVPLSPAFKHSLFESQLEDYASDMQRVFQHVFQNDD